MTDAPAVPCEWRRSSGAPDAPAPRGPGSFSEGAREPTAAARFPTPIFPTDFLFVRFCNKTHVLWSKKTAKNRRENRRVKG